MIEYITIKREVLEQAVEALDKVHEWVSKGYRSFYPVLADLRTALEAKDVEPPCNPHPDAPHGFSRNASHSLRRYVCECEGWEAPDAQNTIDALRSQVSYLEKCLEDHANEIAACKGER